MRVRPGAECEHNSKNTDGGLEAFRGRSQPACSEGRFDPAFALVCRCGGPARSILRNGMDSRARGVLPSLFWRAPLPGSLVGMVSVSWAFPTAIATNLILFLFVALTR